MGDDTRGVPGADGADTESCEPDGLSDSCLIAAWGFFFGWKRTDAEGGIIVARDTGETKRSPDSQKEGEKRTSGDVEDTCRAKGVEEMRCVAGRRRPRLVDGRVRTRVDALTRCRASVYMARGIAPSTLSVIQGQENTSRSSSFAFRVNN